jgi:hypothetical protein
MDLGKQKFLNFDLGKVWLGFWIVGICIAFLIISVWIVSTQDYADTDFFSFWLAGYSIRVGEDPYDAEWWTLAHDMFGAEWISDATFLYPLPLAIFFIPLGFFSLKQAFVLWIFLSQWMILLASVLLLRRENWSMNKKYFLPILVGIFLFRPVILTMFHGQLGAFFLLILVIMLILWANHKWLLGGLLLPLLALKPSFGLLIGAMLGIWLIAQKKWTALAGVLVACFGLCLLGWLYNPTWISEFLAIGSGKLGQTFGYSPTVWGVSGQLCSQSRICTVIFGGLFGGLLLIAYFYMLLKSADNLSSTMGMSLIIPIALLVTPYGWAYDQILLIIPILIVIMAMTSRGFPYIVPAALFLLISLLALVFVLLAMEIEYDMWSAGITLVCLSLVVGLLGGTKQLPVMR